MPKRIMRRFRIREISAVDNPAQEHARMAIMKRRTDRVPVLKSGQIEVIEPIIKRYITPSDGAVSFGEVLSERLKEDQYYEVMREISPLISSLDTSLCSIAGDANIDGDTKQIMMRETLEQFMTQIRSQWSDVEDAFGKALEGQEGDDHMPKTIQELQKEITELTGKLSEVSTALAENKDNAEKVTELGETVKNLSDELTKVQETLRIEMLKSAMSDDEKTHLATLKGEDRKAFIEASPEDRAKVLKKDEPANEETIEVGGTVVKKSVVGEAAFAVFKAQQEQVEKANKAAAESAEAVKKEREQRELLEFTKQAEKDWDNLPGELKDKAQVMKVMHSMTEDQRIVLEKMLDAGNKAIKAAYTTIGHQDGRGEADAKKFNEVVDKIRSEEKLTRTEAMKKARSRHPDLFDAYQKSGAN